jgi:aconitate hydratase 2/2-methylisocitrate dehydratase
VRERACMVEGFSVAPKPLDVAQVKSLIEELKAGSPESKTLLNLLTHRVPPGVDGGAKVKSEYLSAIAKQEEPSPPNLLLTRQRAIELLGTMQGGYNVATLIELLQDPSPEIASSAADQLKHTLLVFDSFKSVEQLHRSGVAAATAVLESWVDAEWYLEKPPVPSKWTVTIFKVTGETNTDDLSPAQDAWSRPDIPLHATVMLKNPSEGIEPIVEGKVGPLAQLAALSSKGFPLAYVGEVVGTGSSRKSATNSVLWFIGEDIPYVPNIKRGGMCLGDKIAPIFFNTMEDSGALPIEMDVSTLNTGDVVDIYPHEGRVCKHDSDDVVTTFELKTHVLLDEVRAGGRIPLIIGRSLPQRLVVRLEGMQPSQMSSTYRSLQTISWRDILWRRKLWAGPAVSKELPRVSTANRT